MRIVTVVFVSICLIAVSCKRGKVRKLPKRSTTSGRSIGKVMTGAVVATGAYLVTEEVLKQAMKEASGKPPIQAEFKNADITPVSMNITDDGKKWIPTIIDPHEVYTFDSSNGGIIGVECNGKYLKIDQSNYFTINNNGGTVNFYGH